MSLDTLETFPTDSERMGFAALSRASLVYALGGLAYKGVALLTIPVLARLLSPANLGLLDLAAVVATLIGLIALLGTDQAVAFHQPRGRNERDLWGSALAIVVLGGGGLAIVALAFQVPLAAFLTGDGANGPIVAAAGVYGAVVALTATALNAVRLRGSPTAYAIASFVIVTTEMGAALGIAWFGLGPVALMVLGWAVGATLVLAIIVPRFMPRPSWPRLPTMRTLAVYGAPFVPAAVAWLVGDAWIRGVLARELGPETLGEYGIAYRVASLLGLVVTGFGVAWYPYLFRSPAATVVPRASNALGILILAVAVLGVAVTALAPEIIGIVAGAEYADARQAVGPLAGGMVALAAFVLVGAVVGTSGSTRRIAVAALIGAGVQVVSSVPLVPALGLAGAGLASLIGYVVSAVVLGTTERRLVGGGRPLVIGAVIALAIIGLVVAASVPGWPLVARMALVLAYAGVAALAARYAVSSRAERDVAS